jgi:hypothetical protein
MEATEQVKAANEKQLLWQIQREEWREQRRRERQVCIFSLDFRSIQL